MPLACWVNLLSFRLNIAKRCPYIIKIIHFDAPTLTIYFTSSAFSVSETSPGSYPRLTP